MSKETSSLDLELSTVFNIINLESRLAVCSYVVH
jgi:hypothetical protein